METPERKPLDAALRAAVVLLALWVLALGAFVVVILPCTKGADEGDHFEYAYYLAREHRLPDPRRDPVLEAHHPPLAHALYGFALEGLESLDRSLGADAFAGRDASRMLGRKTLFEPGRPLLDVLADRGMTRRVPPMRENNGLRDGEEVRLDMRVLETRTWTFHALRLPGLVAAVLCLLLVLAILRELFPDSPKLAVLATAVLATTASYPFYFATISNDPWVTLLSCLAIRDVLRARRLGRLHDAAPLIRISVVLGLAFLVKLHALGAAVFAGLVVLLDREGAPLPRRLRSLALLVAGPVLIAGWWHVRQVLLQGQPIASANHADFRPNLFRLDEYHPSLLLEFLSSMTTSFFAKLGNDKIAAPPLYYIPLTGLVALAACALLFLKRRPESSPGGTRPALPLLAALVGAGVVVANLLRLDAIYNAHNGRYLYPVVPLLMIAGVAGLDRALGRRLPAVLGAAVAWNLAFAAIIYGGVFLNAYSIPAEKLERGRVLAYWDAGHEFFDQKEAGGDVLSQRFGDWRLPRHTLRLAQQSPGVPALRYRCRVPGGRPLQVRVRYPSLKGIAGTDVPDPYAVVMRSHDAVLHGPWSIWGECGELRFPVPPEGVVEGAVSLWWDNLIPKNPLVAVSEVWVEEAWLQISEGPFAAAGNSELRFVLRNLDSRTPRRAALYAQLDGETLGALDDESLAAEGGRSLVLPLSRRPTPDELSRLRVHLVDLDPSPWASAKVIHAARVVPPHAGRVEVPDIAVLRHRNEPGRETLLAEFPFHGLPAGRWELRLSTPRGQDPLGDGRLRLEVEGGRRLEGGGPRTIPWAPDLVARAEAWERDPEAASRPFVVRIVATGRGGATPYDLDRLEIVPLPGPEAPGHDYPIRDAAAR